MRTGSAGSGKLLAGLAAVLVLLAASDPAMARRGHGANRHHHGARIAVGVILAAPMYRYFPAPVYAAPVIAAPAAPTVYIERGEAQPTAAQPGGDWWYYCAESRAYYPYVKECAAEWQRVAAEPPANR